MIMWFIRLFSEPDGWFMFSDQDGGIWTPHPGTDLCLQPKHASNKSHAADIRTKQHDRRIAQPILT